uniref:RstB2 n=1 Tax=Affertcholeramvirus CTXphi TaxID=141904 RepID=Q8H9F9_9VIRU|nr:RstB2 [Affertcholeramvirus CTXphi]AAN61559.1 RstB2 [Affertcholeramvirus CTXphi]AAN61561.1 RstB2 [Affertcholeramvirus CTXphi]AAN61563.1 RstB2 [Affertcholeramvirus CTXphi]
MKLWVINMKSRFVVFGASHSLIPVLLVGKPIRQWKNDKGQCLTFGLQHQEVKFVSSDAMTRKLEQTAFPVLVTFDNEPDPEDPSRNLVIDYQVVCSLFDNVPGGKPLDKPQPIKS